MDGWRWCGIDVSASSPPTPPPLGRMMMKSAASAKILLRILRFVAYLGAQNQA